MQNASPRTRHGLAPHLPCLLAQAPRREDGSRNVTPRNANRKPHVRAGNTCDGSPARITPGTGSDPRPYPK